MDHVGYHGTAAAFTSFSEEMLGSAADRSANGALGVWVFTERSYADRYAVGAQGRTLKVTSAGRKAMKVDVTQMRRDHDSAQMSDDPVAWFRRLRAELIVNGYDRIDIVERDDTVDMSVLLDLGTITSVDDVTH
ncbi:MAG: hypothetical protein DI537_10705 [Stutzerimonas stutzeri]|nr:MAG: hypothetical protein DI537_10705 [Stutzerimonas stutzeri]